MRDGVVSGSQLKFGLDFQGLRMFHTDEDGQIKYPAEEAVAGAVMFARQGEDGFVDFLPEYGRERFEGNVLFVKELAEGPTAGSEGPFMSYTAQSATTYAQAPLNPRDPNAVHTRPNIQNIPRSQSEADRARRARLDEVLLGGYNPAVGPLGLPADLPQAPVAEPLAVAEPLLRGYPAVPQYAEVEALHAAEEAGEVPDCTATCTPCPDLGLWNVRLPVAQLDAAASDGPVAVKIVKTAGEAQVERVVGEKIARFHGYYGGGKATLAEIHAHPRREIDEDTFRREYLGTFQAEDRLHRTGEAEPVYYTISLGLDDLGLDLEGLAEKYNLAHGSADDDGGYETTPEADALDAWLEKEFNLPGNPAESLDAWLEKEFNLPGNPEYDVPLGVDPIDRATWIPTDDYRFAGRVGYNFYPPRPEPVLDGGDEIDAAVAAHYAEHSVPGGFAAQVLETVTNRGSDYGTPSENHQLTADLLSAHFRRKWGEDGVTFTAEDVCLINIYQKMSRLAYSSKDDSLLDIAGYCENVAMLHVDQRAR